MEARREGEGDGLLAARGMSFCDAFKVGDVQSRTGVKKWRLAAARLVPFEIEIAGLIDRSDALESPTSGGSQAELHHFAHKF